MPKIQRGEDRPTIEEDVEPIILELLGDGIIRSTAQITTAIKAAIPRVAADYIPARRRPNEVVVDQVIANALREVQPLCRGGFIERTGRGQFRITAAGKRELLKRQESFRLAEEAWEELGYSKLDIP